MAARPQNVGIKAIEIYFPSQVCRNSAIRVKYSSRIVLISYVRSASTRSSSRSSMALAGEVYHRSGSDQDELL